VEALGLPLGSYEHLGGDVEAALREEASEPRVIEENDRISRVEREKADVSNERGVDQPSSFASGKYSILCACATGSHVTWPL
jgi:hypothetical protein